MTSKACAQDRLSAVEDRRLHRSIARPGLLLFADMALRATAGVIVGSAVLRHLGPKAVGQLGVALALTTVLRAISGLGLDAVVPQRVAVASVGETNELISGAFALRLIASLALFPIQMAFLWTANRSIASTLSFGVIALGLFGGPLEVGWWYTLGRGRATSGVPWRIGTTAMFVLARVVALHNGSALEVFAVISGFELIVPELVLLAHARRNGLAVPLFAHPLRQIAPVRKVMNSSWQLGLGGMCFIFLQRLDLLVVDRILGTTEAGRYSAIQRLCEGPLLLCSVVVAVGGPAIASSHDRESAGFRRSYSRLLRYLVGAALAIGTILSFGARVLVHTLLGDKFAGLAGTFTIYLWSIVPVFIGAATARLLIDVGKQNRLLLNGFVGLVVSIPLTVVFVRAIGIQGAAWASTLSYVLAIVAVPLVDPQQRAVSLALAGMFDRRRPE